MNPHVTQNSYIISSQFRPGKPRGPPRRPRAGAAVARGHRPSPPMPGPAARDGPVSAHRRCPEASLAQFLSTPLLSVWAPGHGADTLPRGNRDRVAGRKPRDHAGPLQPARRRPAGQNSLVLDTVPASTPLLPLHLDMALAPPELPCPAGRHRPVVRPLRVARRPGAALRPGRRPDRQRDRSRLRRRSREPAGRRHRVVHLAHRHERVHRPVPGPHASAGAQLHAGPQPRNAPGPDRAQRPELQLPLPEGLQPDHADPGDRRRASSRSTAPTTRRSHRSCPALRKAPSHFVTWGDGSSDEMCIGLAWISAKLPDSHASL